MPNDEMTIRREWLSVDDAFLACQEAGLERTKKTIRSWARNEHVEAQKQTTPTGERWMVEKTSLSVKIRAELEFQRQAELGQTGSNRSEPVRTSANRSEPVQTGDEPVRTGTNRYEPRQTGAHEDGNRVNGLEEKLVTLEASVRSLEVDKAVRDQHIDFLTRQNAEGQQGLLSQSRYIGHLETQLKQLGVTPDQRFLDAPVPKREEALEPEVVNPDQQPLGPVHP